MMRMVKEPRRHTNDSEAFLLEHETGCEQRPPQTPLPHAAIVLEQHRLLLQSHSHLSQTARRGRTGFPLASQIRDELARRSELEEARRGCV